MKSQSAAAAPGQSLHAMMDCYEKQILDETLAASKSIRQAAQKLGISHTALLKKLKKYPAASGR
jgi:transcriptional regulator of aroF, aroG, tyrA and aromatic amino acid transport